MQGEKNPLLDILLETCVEQREQREMVARENVLAGGAPRAS